MTIPLRATIQRGEPFTAVLEVEAGDPASIVVTANLKPTVGRNLPDEGIAVAANFTPSFVPASGGEAARWLLTLSDADTEALDPGQYVFDARLTLAGATVAITEPVFLWVMQRVTAP